jgi:hypothetical protein
VRATEEDYGKKGTGDDSDEAEDSDEAGEVEEAQSEGWGSDDEGGLGSVCGRAGTGEEGDGSKARAWSRSPGLM